ncbi:MAG: serine/threonine-protein phosphatase, partial [Actinomycetota bacterium]|nr:serine/threonine-protein phosphatase [Actinomycetota bacterium]
PTPRAFTVGLVAQAAQAVERAQAADVRRNIADTFQRALLTPPPEVAGVEMAARYMSAGPTAEIGGDWYDAFPLAGGSLALVVGDVVGHDLTAATAMAQLRAALRGLAYDTGQAPGRLLSRLDDLVYGLGVTPFATLLLGILERTADGAAFTWASAGHPSPLLLHPDGSTRYLDGGLSTPVGIHLAPEVRRPQASADLPVGSTLLLYTDGLIEQRRAPLDEGLKRLAAQAEGAADQSLDALCDHLLTTCLGDTGDDVALLAVRITG